jgi:glutamine synthetase
MDVMEKVAERHDLKVLFHENRSKATVQENTITGLSYRYGYKLIESSKTPMSNLQFLTFLYQYNQSST